MHSGVTGGTFLTNKDLMKNVEKNYDVFLLSSENHFLKLFEYSKDKLILIKEYPRKKWSAKNFHDSWLTYIYFDILINYDINLIHIRHLLNHSFDLPEVAKKLGVPVVLSLHDFYFICPFYTLIDENNNYCAGICTNNSNCYNPLKSLEDISSKNIITKWRNEVSKMFKFIDYFVTTADFVKDLFLSIYSELNNDNFKVIEHGRDFPDLDQKLYEIPSLNEPIKILCPANYLNIMKGSEVIKQIKQEDIGNNLEFHFLGNCRDGIEEFGISHGTFERDDFYKKVSEIKPSFVGIFSTWPETFCHTLTEAWSCGIPVLGSNIGVIKDRIQKTKGGWIMDINNPKSIYDNIISISSDLNEYEKILNNISKIYIKTTNEMAKEYLDIYKSLLNN